jgi:hypothetical protein
MSFYVCDRDTAITDPGTIVVNFDLFLGESGRPI